MRWCARPVIVAFALVSACGDAGVATTEDATSAASDETGGGPDSSSGPGGSGQETGEASGSSSDGATTSDDPTTGEPPPPGNFEERCSAPEVIACWSFDTPDETDPLLIDSGFSPPEWDGTTPSEGGGSVHMSVLAGSEADTSGSFVLDFSPGIGEGESLYVQWRQRYSASFLDADFGGNGWKQVLVHENTSTAGCSDSEIVVNSYYDANRGSTLRAQRLRSSRWKPVRSYNR